MFRPSVRRSRQSGTSTSEYAVGTLGAVTVAGLLLGPGSGFTDWIHSVFEKTIELLLAMEPDSVLTLPQLFSRAVESLWPW